jgi:hypothetical protein
MSLAVLVVGMPVRVIAEKSERSEILETQPPSPNLTNAPEMGREKTSLPSSCYGSKH